MKNLKVKVLLILLGLFWISPLPAEPTIKETEKIEISGKLSSRYGNRYHPVYKTRKFHSGIDVIIKPTELNSPVSGTVIFAKWEGGYGNTIKIQNESVIYMFSHLSKMKVKVGDEVSIGDNIGIVGRTGLATGVHLHIQVYDDGKLIDPLIIFNVKP